MDSNKKITRTWLSGRFSTTCVLPKDFCKEFGLDEPCDVVVEKLPERKGLLITKLDI